MIEDYCGTGLCTRMTFLLYHHSEDLWRYGSGRFLGFSACEHFDVDVMRPYPNLL